MRRRTSFLFLAICLFVMTSMPAFAQVDFVNTAQTPSYDYSTLRAGNGALLDSSLVSATDDSVYETGSRGQTYEAQETPSYSYYTERAPNGALISSGETGAAGSQYSGVVYAGGSANNRQSAYENTGSSNMGSSRNSYGNGSDYSSPIQSRTVYGNSGYGSSGSNYGNQSTQTASNYGEGSRSNYWAGGGTSSTGSYGGSTGSRGGTASGSHSSGTSSYRGGGTVSSRTGGTTSYSHSTTTTRASTSSYSHASSSSSGRRG